MMTKAMMQGGRRGGQQMMQALALANALSAGGANLLRDYRGIGIMGEYSGKDLLIRTISNVKKGSELMKFYRGIRFDKNALLGMKEEPIGLFSLGMNFGEYYDFMMKSMSPLIAQKVDAVLKEMKDKKGIDVEKALIYNLAGNINFGAFDGANFSGKKMNMFLTFNVKNRKLMQDFLDKLMKEVPPKFLKKKNFKKYKGYEVTIKRSKVYVAMSGRNVIVGMDEKTFTQALSARKGRGFTRTMKDHELKKDLLRDQSVVYISMEELIKTLKNFPGAKTDAKDMEKYLSDLDYLLIKSYNRGESFFADFVVKTSFKEPFFHGIGTIVNQISEDKKKRQQARVKAIEERKAKGAEKIEK